MLGLIKIDCMHDFWWQSNSIAYVYIYTMKRVSQLIRRTKNYKSLLSLHSPYTCIHTCTLLDTLVRMMHTHDSNELVPFYIQEYKNIRNDVYAKCEGKRYKDILSLKMYIHMTRLKGLTSI